MMWKRISEKKNMARSIPRSISQIVNGFVVVVGSGVAWSGMGSAWGGGVGIWMIPAILGGGPADSSSRAKLSGSTGF